jgi:hypothetical protein
MHVVHQNACAEKFFSLAERTQNIFHRWLIIRRNDSLLAELMQKCLKDAYLGQIEYNFQKSSVTCPMVHRDSSSAKKVFKQISCLCIFKALELMGTINLRISHQYFKRCSSRSFFLYEEYCGRNLKSCYIVLQKSFYFLCKIPLLSCKDCPLYVYSKKSDVEV